MFYILVQIWFEGQHERATWSARREKLIRVPAVPAVGNVLMLTGPVPGIGLGTFELHTVTCVVWDEARRMFLVQSEEENGFTYNAPEADFCAAAKELGWVEDVLTEPVPDAGNFRFVAYMEGHLISSLATSRKQADTLLTSLTSRGVATGGHIEKFVNQQVGWVLDT